MGAGLSGVALLGLAIVVQRRTGVVWAWAFAGLVWSLVVIALVTLLPAQGDPGVVYAEDRPGTCSFDLGGPAPDGFWIFAGGQRLLNMLIFAPSGALMVVAAARWRAGRVLVPLGLVLLAAYSIGIEGTQLALARLDRACDVTDVVDNVTGAALGAVMGVLLLPLLRPWRARR